MKNQSYRILYFLCMIFFFTVFFQLKTGFARTYHHTYTFETPTINQLENGQQLIQFADTWLKDDEIGAPIMPVKTAKIFVPADESVQSVKVKRINPKKLEGVFTIQHAVEAYPSSGRGPVKPTNPDVSIYWSNEDYPAAGHKKRGSQFLSGAQIVLVDMMPLVYSPLSGQVRMYQKIQVRIETRKQIRPAGVRAFQNSPASREKIVKTIDNTTDFSSVYPVLSNPDAEEQSLKREVQPLSDREYVIITTAEMATAFETLALHRQSKDGGGLSTYVQTMDNIQAAYPGVDDAEKMRNFIIDMFDNYGTKYVLLGGDCDGEPGDQTIPTRGAYATINSIEETYIPTDLYFGCLDGSWNADGDNLWGETDDGIGGGDIDWFSEVWVGRIPADTPTEALNQINKIIAFETGSLFNKTLLVGENLDNTPTWGGDRMDWLHSFMESMSKTEIYDRDWTDPENNWTRSDLLPFINSNAYHWINHLGHGYTNWNMKLGNWNLEDITNTSPFFEYSQACYSGSIDNRSTGSSFGTDSILEGLVNSSEYGAFAVIGNSRYGWYNPGDYVQGASNLVHKEFIEAVLSEGYSRIGEANQRSKADLNFSSMLYRWIAFETNLLGCPFTSLVHQNTDRQILWNQPISQSNSNVYSNQDFETTNDVYDIWNSDDFQNPVPWSIDTIFVPGSTWNPGSDLTCALNLHFKIYADNSGVPAGVPDGGSGGSGTPVWSLSLSPQDARITLSPGAGGFLTNVTLRLDTPVQLKPGAYWLLFYPEMDLEVCGQYGLHVSDTLNGYEGQTSNPGDGFTLGATSWTEMTSVQPDLTQSDWAFRLEGNVKNQSMPWLNLLLN